MFHLPEMMSSNLTLHRLNTGRECRVATAVTMLAQYLFRFTTSSSCGNLLFHCLCRSEFRWLDFSDGVYTGIKDISALHLSLAESIAPVRLSSLFILTDLWTSFLMSQWVLVLWPQWRFLKRAIRFSPVHFVWCLGTAGLTFVHGNRRHWTRRLA